MRSETEYRDRARLRAFLQEAIDTAPDLRVRWQAWIRYAEHGGFISADARTAAESAREARRIALELKDPPLIAASTAAHSPTTTLPAASTTSSSAKTSLSMRRTCLAQHRGRSHRPFRSEGDCSGRGSSTALARCSGRSTTTWCAREGCRSASAPARGTAQRSRVACRSLGRGRRYAYEARAILEDGFLGIAHAVSASQIIVAGSLGRVDEGGLDALACVEPSDSRT